MKTLLLLLLLPHLAGAQFYSDRCQIAPEFKGGDVALTKIIHDSIVYPIKDTNQAIYFSATLSIDNAGKTNYVEYNGQVGDTIQHQLRKVFKKLPLFIPGSGDCKKTIYVSIPIDAYIIERSKSLWSDSLFHAETHHPLIKGWDTLTANQQRRKTREINEIGINGRNGYQTKITDMEFNFVNDRVDRLMNNLKLFVKGTGTLIGKDAISFDYGKLKVTYHFINDKDEMIITKCDIGGDVWTALNFFVRFWHTTLKFENLKENEVVYVGYLDERIGFKLQPGSKTATIAIRSATPISYAKPAQH